LEAGGAIAHVGSRPPPRGLVYPLASTLAVSLAFPPHLPSRPWITGKPTPRGHPAELMAHVYKTLHDLGWRWKTPSDKAFQIRVLVNRPEFRKPVRVSLQLFRTLSSFTLDIQRIDGDVLAFFSVSLQLMRELQRGWAAGAST
jgi:hypothetical protein